MLPHFAPIQLLRERRRLAPRVPADQLHPSPAAAAAAAAAAIPTRFLRLPLAISFFLLRSEVGKSLEGGADITAVSVDEQHVRKASLRQRGRHVPHHRDERRRPQGHRAREGLVVVAHAVVYARGEDRASGLGNAAGDGLCIVNHVKRVFSVHAAGGVSEKPWFGFGGRGEGCTAKREVRTVQGRCTARLCTCVDGNTDEVPYSSSGAGSFRFATDREEGQRPRTLVTCRIIRKMTISTQARVGTLSILYIGDEKTLPY